MSAFSRLKTLLLGNSRDPRDTSIFRKISLIAFFAWVGLGADGLSSSCYGPQEAFITLAGHPFLSIFVAIGTVLTIFIICTSYNQIVELFPSGGGGYLVASKLLSPGWGMFSGCALLIDYVLTIAVSIASGSEAVFSLLPLSWHAYRLEFALAVIVILMLLNMRGVKESVLTLLPIFLIFLLTHVFIILYALLKNVTAVPALVASVNSDVASTVSQLGFWGMIFLLLRSYSMGAGTYTGIEAVSNGIPVLREPKVQTAKYTMRYMAISLSFVVVGLMVAYLVYSVAPASGKTLNAILFENATSGWGKSGYIFILLALASEATLLFVAAQTGFIDGPRVLANMAVDKWFPTRFSTLSDRLVTQNGILIMGGLALAVMGISRGSVRFLVVLYSINVFITFCLSQSGMVRHWWQARKEVKAWFKKLLVNGIGLVLTASILVSMIIFKFFEGGWITLAITGSLMTLAVMVKRHYKKTGRLLQRLDTLVEVVEESLPVEGVDVGKAQLPDPKAKSAVLLVSGFNGMGLHTLFGVIRLFGGVFKNFIFLQVGVVDAGNFKGAQEVKHLEEQANQDLDRYTLFMRRQGFYAEGRLAIGVDVIDEVEKASDGILKRFPNAVFFGGQLIFPKDTFMLRLLHNNTVFSLQKRLYWKGIPLVILPIRV